MSFTLRELCALFRDALVLLRGNARTGKTGARNLPDDSLPVRRPRKPKQGELAVRMDTPVKYNANQDRSTLIERRSK